MTTIDQIASHLSPDLIREGPRLLVKDIMAVFGVSRTTALSAIARYFRGR